MTQYNLKTELLFTATFTRKSDSSLVDPTTVVFEIELPDGTTETYTYPTDSEVTNPSTGVYVLTYTPTQENVYGYRAYGTGTVKVGSSDKEFTMRDTRFE